MCKTKWRSHHNRFESYSNVKVGNKNECFTFQIVVFWEPSPVKRDRYLKRTRPFLHFLMLVGKSNAFWDKNDKSDYRILAAYFCYKKIVLSHTFLIYLIENYLVANICPLLIIWKKVENLEQSSKKHTKCKTLVIW